MRKWNGLAHWGVRNSPWYALPFSINVASVVMPVQKASNRYAEGFVSFLIE